MESLLVMMPNRLRDLSFFFTIVLVCCSECTSAEECIFTNKGGNIEGLPPTTDTLTQHAKRALYQGW